MEVHRVVCFERATRGMKWVEVHLWLVDVESTGPRLIEEIGLVMLAWT